MTDTQSFEYVLDGVKNAEGVAYDTENNRVIVFVTEKLPAEALADDQLVARNVRVDSDVLGTGEFHTEDVHPTPQGTDAHRDRHRPIVGGISEGPTSRRSAGTGGPVATVTDASHERWYDTDEVEEGDVVRLSNAHVYVDSPGRSTVPAQSGPAVVQPAIIDGARVADVVGEVIGHGPLVDGVRADCAARTIAQEGQDIAAFLNLPADAGHSVRREGVRTGETLTKSGRTTGVRSGEIIATSASLRVRMGGSDESSVLFRDQLVTQSMSRSGDSGSAVFDETGALVGLLFAGSEQATIVNRIANVEARLGVEMGIREPEPEPEPDPDWHEFDRAFRRAVAIQLAGVIGSLEAIRRAVDPDSDSDPDRDTPDTE